MTTDDKIKFYNKMMGFINRKIELILAREGELPTSYFQANTEKDMDTITSKIKTAKDIEDNWDAIVKLDKELKDGYKGLKVSGRI